MKYPRKVRASFRGKKEKLTGFKIWKYTLFWLLIFHFKLCQTSVYVPIYRLSINYFSICFPKFAYFLPTVGISIRICSFSHSRLTYVGRLFFLCSFHNSIHNHSQSFPTSSFSHGSHSSHFSLYIILLFSYFYSCSLNFIQKCVIFFYYLSILPPHFCKFNFFSIK